MLRGPSKQSDLEYFRQSRFHRMHPLNKVAARVARRKSSVIASCMMETLDSRLLLDATLPNVFGPIDTGLTASATAITNNIANSNGAFTGQIIVAGTTAGASSQDQFLAGFGTSGTLAATFGTNGTTTQDVSGTDTVDAVISQPGGRIFTVGSGTQVSGATPVASPVATWRNYNSNGSPATTAPGGVFNFAGAKSSAFHGVALLPGNPNAAIAVGEVTTSSGTDFLIGEIGSPAAGDQFPVTGNSFDINSSTDIARAVGFQTNGSTATRIIVVGTATNKSGSRIALVAEDPNGALDKTFIVDGASGNPTLSFSNNAAATAMVVEPDNSILIAGVDDTTGTGDAVFIHLLANGSFDTHFGTNGISRPFDIPFTPAGLAVSEDGSISTVDQNTFAVGRITSDGKAIGGQPVPEFHLGNTTAGAAPTSARGAGVTIFQGGAGTGDVLYAAGNVTYPNGQTRVGLFSQMLTPISNTDLSIASITAPATTVTFNGSQQTLPVQVSAVINVAGSTSGAPATIDFFLSRDTLASNADDIAVGSAALSAGASSVSTTLSVPSSLPSGTYHVVAHIFPINTAEQNTFENNAFNNTAINTANVITIKNKADFSLTQILIGNTQGQQITSVAAGAPFLVLLTVNNNGAPVGDPVPVRFDFSLTPDFKHVAFSAPDAVSISDGIPAGASNHTVFVSAPATAQLAPYFIRAVINPRGTVPEFNTGNNSIVTPSTLTLTVASRKPDYTIQITKAPSSVIEGDRTSVTVKVTNEGGVAINKQIVLEVEESKTSGGAPLGAFPVIAVATVTPNLAPGKSHNYTISFLYPVGYGFGKGANPRIFFLALANVGSHPVPELNANNNFAFAPKATTARSRFVDLEPSTNFKATTSISTVKVTNKGSVPANGTAHITLVAFNVNSSGQLFNGQLIQDGSFGVSIPVGGSHTYNFIYKPATPVVGERIIEAFITSNGVQSTPAFSKNLVAFT
jgi:hypothetical protein